MISLPPNVLVYVIAAAIVLLTILQVLVAYYGAFVSMKKRMLRTHKRPGIPYAERVFLFALLVVIWVFAREVEFKRKLELSILIVVVIASIEFLASALWKGYIRKYPASGFQESVSRDDQAT